MKRKASSKITRTVSRELRDRNFRREVDGAVVDQIHHVELIIQHLKKTTHFLNERDRVNLVNESRKHLSKIRASGKIGAEEAKILYSELKEIIN